MSDLISRQAVYEYLESKFNEYDISVFGNEFAGKILDGIDDIPTAYDVDAVVEQLEKKREEARGLIGKPHMDYGTLCGWDSALFYAIDIIRKGGVDENNN